MTLLLNYALRWRERVCAVAIVRVCRISSVSAAQIGTDQNMVTHLTLTLTHTAPIILSPVLSFSLSSVQIADTAKRVFTACLLYFSTLAVCVFI